MTRDHRFFHRRQAGVATKVMTVEVIAIVDTSGHLLREETKIAAVSTPQRSPSPNAAGSVAGAAVSAALHVAEPRASSAVAVLPSVPVSALPSLPKVPSVPPMPTVTLPVVPSVPPFPSDLRVPAYPFASGPSPAAYAPTSSVASPVPTNGPTNSSVHLSPSHTFNSTMPSMVLVTPTSSSASRSSVVASDSLFAVQGFTQPLSSDASETPTSSAIAGSHNNYAGGGAVGTAVPPAGPAHTSAAGASTSGSTPLLQTPRVVGSVVGSLAGAVFILAIILLLLQRHKRRRRGALPLGDESTDRAPPMVQNESRNNRIPSAFLHRFSGMSRSTVDTTSSAGERSFQRVSGRKLPSAFSEGMTSDQFARGGTLSGSSFYTEAQGTYDSQSSMKEFGKEIGDTATAGGTMSLRPGPRRTPIIRHPDDDINPFADPVPFPKPIAHLNPPHPSNKDPPRGALGRSLYSYDGSRSSKFTENV
ncbi:hypothetical protein ACEQ8H_005673 [Pleosporales sp. CAS-2024a]